MRSELFTIAFGLGFKVIDVGIAFASPSEPFSPITGREWARLRQSHSGAFQILMQVQGSHIFRHLNPDVSGRGGGNSMQLVLTIVCPYLR